MKKRINGKMKRSPSITFLLLKTSAIRLGADLIAWQRHMATLTRQWLVVDNDPSRQALGFREKPAHFFYLPPHTIWRNLGMPHAGACTGASGSSKIVRV
jgi:hypothetical protein